jgi:hypothetical protein
LERDLNAFAAGGVADGDWPSGGFERVCKHRNACVFLIEEKKMESVDGRTVAQPKPRQNGCVCKRRGGLFLLFVDIQLCVPASRHE